MGYPIRVLFLCTGNTARSQMAEGILRAVGKEDFEVFSAGSDPRDQVHPLAIQVMRESGIDISHQRTKDLKEFLGQEFDEIITVCDKARDNCPTFPGDPHHIHWGYPDPVAVEGDDETKLQAFRKINTELHNRIHLWVLSVRRRLREEGIVVRD